MIQLNRIKRTFIIIVLKSFSEHGCLHLFHTKTCSKFKKEEAIQFRAETRFLQVFRIYITTYTLHILFSLYRTALWSLYNIQNSVSRIKYDALTVIYYERSSIFRTLLSNFNLK